MTLAISSKAASVEASFSHPLRERKISERVFDELDYPRTLQHAEQQRCDWLIASRCVRPRLVPSTAAVDAVVGGIA